MSPKLVDFVLLDIVDVAIMADAAAKKNQLAD